MRNSRIMKAFVRLAVMGSLSIGVMATPSFAAKTTYVKVPFIQGDTTAQANLALFYSHLAYKLGTGSVAKDTVLFTVPEAGTIVPAGSTVTVYQGVLCITKACEPKTVKVPVLFRDTQAQAKAALKKVGLVYALGAGSDPSYPVAGTNPSPGTTVDVGTTVTVYFGTLLGL